MGRGRGEEKRERERSRLGPGSDSRGCGSANLRALTRGAAPPRSDICPPGARGAERLGRADAALRGRRCTCRGSRPPLRAPSPPAAPASRSVPAAPRPRSPPPGRSRREPSPAPRRRPFSAGPARRLARPTEPRIGLQRAVATTTPKPLRPGRNGPHRWAPARLMSAARAPETRAGRCASRASSGCAPSSADEGRWARPLRARPLGRDEKERPRDGPASGRAGGGRLPRGAGPGTAPGLVAVRRQMDLDPSRSAAFVPSRD